MNGNRQRLLARKRHRILDRHGSWLKPKPRPARPAQARTLESVINMNWDEAERDKAKNRKREQKNKDLKNAFEDTNPFTSTAENQSATT